MSTTKRATGRSVETELTISVAPARVFEAFTLPADLRAWFVRAAEVEARAGGVYNLAWGPGQRVAGTIVELDCPRCFVWDEDWVGGPGITRVAVEFEPVGHGTRLRLRHTGFGDSDDWVEQFTSVSHGWSTELENLRSYLEDGRAKSWPAKEQQA